MSINKLNDDCLINIFMLLNFKDRIRIERVCTRWNNIAKKSWRNVKKLNKLQLEDEKLWGFELMKEINKQRILHVVIQKCCRFLTHISLSRHFSSNETNKLICYVAKYCRFLRGVNTPIQEMLRLDTLKVMTDHCRNLTEISFRTVPCSDKYFSKLFKYNQKLYKVLIAYNFLLTGICLNQLPANCVEVLIIENCYNISLRTVTDVVSKFDKLHTLWYKNGKFEGPELISVPTQLKILHVSFYKGSLNFIEKIKHLEILEIRQCICADDNFLIALAECCKELSHISLSGCMNVTYPSLRKLIYLHKLKVLNINFLNGRFTDENLLKSLEDMAKNRINVISLKITNLNYLTYHKTYEYDTILNALFFQH